MAWLQGCWYARRPPFFLWLFAPLMLLFAAIVGLRRFLYRRGLVPGVLRLPVPVVVVGNLTVGGAGKTPLVLWIAQTLRAAGWHPGIVSRGHLGRENHVPQAVFPDSTPLAAGDEPVLLAVRSGLPVWIGRNRAAAARALLSAHPRTDVLLLDDGLQHYRLKRDVEIVVFDGRGAGNGLLLPAGPLREPLGRLGEAQALVFNGAPDARVLRAAPVLPDFAMRLEPASFYALQDPRRRATAADFQGRALHAVAGIGNPERFFRTLEELGLCFARHPFPDHHHFTAAELDFPAPKIVLMTEKDAVKCARLTPYPTAEIWVLPVTARLPDEFAHYLLESLNGYKAA
ncbi:MAG: tetraacyldisaccharide 4'-kinase [Zoogloeaceae bacterium]|nr:tetraacyldisaccharide 4'-kinase [Zoogloeaceae bacterium]